MADFVFDPEDSSFQRDPQAVYEHLRSEEPLHIANLGGRAIRVLSRYEHVARVLSNSSTRMNPIGTDTPAAYGDGPAAVLWRNAISMMDPPRHSKVRRLIGRPFALRHMTQLQPMVKRIVEEVFAGTDPDNLEAVNDIALKIPMKVICKLLGIPEQDWGSLQAWTVDFLRIFLPDASDADQVSRVQDASQQFIDYFGGLIDERMRKPRDDLTSEFVRLIDHSTLTRVGLIGALRGLLTAGFETTAATISAAFLGFAQQPDQFQRLCDQPQWLTNAVEELLRWETPTQVTVRFLGQSIKLDDEVLERGEAVWLLLGSANHDPTHFADPGSIDIARPVVDHVAFGGGRHSCLGAHLARLELGAALSQLTGFCRRIELRCDTVARRPNFQFRSIESLPAAMRR